MILPNYFNKFETQLWTQYAIYSNVSGPENDKLYYSLRVDNCQAAYTNFKFAIRYGNGVNIVDKNTPRKVQLEVLPFDYEGS